MIFGYPNGTDSIIDIKPYLSSDEDPLIGKDKLYMDLRRNEKTKGFNNYAF